MSIPIEDFFLILEATPPTVEEEHSSLDIITLLPAM